MVTAKQTVLIPTTLILFLKPNLAMISDHVLHEAILRFYFCRHEQRINSITYSSREFISDDADSWMGEVSENY